MGMITVNEDLLLAETLFKSLHGFGELGSVIDVERFLPALFREIEGGSGHFPDAFAAACDDGQDRRAELFGQLLHVNMDAGLTGLVHHIAGEDHGHAHFHHLHGKQHIAFEGRGVSAVNDGVDFAEAELITGYKLFLGVGCQGVGAGQIDKGDRRAVHADRAFLTVYGDAGVVAHVLARSRIGVEKCRLATVRVAGQSYAVSLFPGRRGIARRGRHCVFFIVHPKPPLLLLRRTPLRPAGGTRGQTDRSAQLSHPVVQGWYN